MTQRLEMAPNYWIQELKDAVRITVHPLLSNGSSLVVKHIFLLAIMQGTLSFSHNISHFTI